MKADERTAAVADLVDLARADRGIPGDRPADLAKILHDDQARTVARLHEWSAGFPSGGSTAPAPPRTDAVCPECAARLTDGERHVEGCSEADGTAIDYSDRTGDLACRPDPFARELTAFDAAIVKARNALRDARRSEAAARTALREAHRIVLLATTPNSQADQRPAACISCQRHTDHRGRPRYEPAHRTNLCQFCTKWQSGHGAWPPVKILEAHHRGERMTTQLVARLMRGAA